MSRFVALCSTSRQSHWGNRGTQFIWFSSFCIWTEKPIGFAKRLCDTWDSDRYIHSCKTFSQAWRLQRADVLFVHRTSCRRRRVLRCKTLGSVLCEVMVLCNHTILKTSRKDIRGTVACTDFAMIFVLRALHSWVFDRGVPLRIFSLLPTNIYHKL